MYNSIIEKKKSSSRKESYKNHKDDRADEIRYLLSRGAVSENRPDLSLPEYLQLYSTMLESLAQASNPVDSTNTDVKEFLDLYFCLRPINPLKSTILSGLKSFLSGNTLEKALCEVIDSYFAKEYHISALVEFVSLMMCLNNIFDDNPVAESCVECSVDKIFKSLEMVMSECMCLFRNSSGSPVSKEDVIKYFHSITQLVISFLHRAVLKSVPYSFQNLCMCCIKDDAFPLNTKINIAIIICLLSKNSGSQVWLSIIEGNQIADPLTRIAFTVGILSAISVNDLIIRRKGTSILEGLLNTILDIELQNSSESKIIIGVSRGVNCVTKCFIDLSSNGFDIFCESNLLDSILDYLLIHLDHYIDTVRHVSLQSLQNVISICNNESGRYLLDKILMEFIYLSPYWRAKYVILLSLIGHIPVEDIIFKVPDLISQLLTSIKETKGAKHVVTCLEKVLQHFFEETDDKNAWIDSWLCPLIDIVNDESHYILEIVFSQVIKLHKPSIQHIINLPVAGSKKAHIDLMCLKVGQKEGVLIDNCDSFNQLWKGAFEYHVLDGYLHNQDEEIRLTFLSIIIDSAKTTAEFSQQDLNIVLEFIKYNIYIQSPPFRQNLSAMFKKLLNRLDDSLRHAKKKSQVNSSLLEGIYLNFQKKLIQLCFENMFCNSSYSRRACALNLLSQCLERNIFPNELLNEEMTQTLIYLLCTDTFEESIIITKSLLCSSDSSLKLKELPVADAVRDCLKHASSIRPPDCINTAYCLSSLLKLYGLDPVFIKLAEVFGAINPDIVELSTFSIMTVLKIKLSEELSIAEKDLLAAAKRAPMYGLLFTMRHLLECVDLRTVSVSEEWSALMAQLVPLAMKCSAAVSSVVNNASPEGHLPMDLDSGSYLNTDVEANQPSSQLLLLFSWRTVKEVSLLLGEIVQRIKINPNYRSDNFCVSNVIMIGEHFLSLLSEVRHRGAFEQAYVGFCKLASALLKSDNATLQELPKSWLRETLSLISSPEPPPSFTRRSAGIPFIVQGLVCSEKETGGGGSNFLKVVMPQLLDLAADTRLEARVHAINTLRALFRNTKLSELCQPYVATTFVISINSFSSSLWPERNSATLLFSSLITRVFGVNRSRTEISWKNKLTGRIFFQRYPPLYTFILSKLEGASDSNVQSIFPILLLLSRLYPSSLDGMDSSLELNKFVPYIIKCGSSKIMKVRQLAACAMVSLVDPSRLDDQICSLIKLIEQSSEENQIHGLLLQVLRLIMFAREISPDYLNKFECNIQSWFISLHSNLDKCHCSVNKAVCLRLLLILYTKFSDSVSFDLELISMFIEKNVFPYMFHNASHPKAISAIGMSELLEMSTLFKIVIAYKKSVKDLISTVMVLLSSVHYEVFQTIFTLLVGLFNGDSDDSELMVLISDHFARRKIEVLNCLRESVELSDFLFNKLSSNPHSEDLAQILKIAKQLPILINKIASSNSGFIRFLKSRCDIGSEEVFSTLLSCVGRYFNSLDNISEEDCTEATCLLKTALESGFSVRIAAANLLSENYNKMMVTSPTATVLDLWTCVLHLLLDDEEEIQTKMSSILCNKGDPLFTLQLFLNSVVESVMEKHIICAVLLGWAMENFCVDQELLKNEDKAFEREPVVGFYEELVVTRECVDRLGSMLTSQPSLLEATIDPPVAQWLHSIAFLPPSPASSLSSFLLQLRSSLTSLRQVVKTGYSYFQEFSPKYQLYKLREDKLSLLYKMMNEKLCSYDFVNSMENLKLDEYI